MPDFTTTKGKNLKIAVLSGKGGTGKTLLAVNLAAASPGSVYVDCDVEEPNGHLFFKPKWKTEESVSVKVPEVIPELCDGCRECVEFCSFNALAYVAGKLKIFEEVCHSCGGCLLVCPKKALKEKEKAVGKVSVGHSGETTVISGMMKTGVASGIPIIQELLKKTKKYGEKKPVFIDCPPGSACIVMESIKDADFCLLVAEPTLFGKQNFEMVHELVRIFNKPYAAVINKSTGEADPVEEYCLANGIKILSKIPFDMDLAKLSSDALIAVRENPVYDRLFSEVIQKIYGEVSHETAAYTER